MNEDRMFGAWFVFCAVLSIAMTCVGIWAVITVVQWLVTK